LSRGWSTLVQSASNLGKKAARSNMAEGVSRLKQLLLDKEQRELGVLANRIDTIFDRAGTNDRLRHSVAEVLAESFREVEGHKERRGELAAAVSPVIIETVRREVRASANELADQLHPHMGRMISAYVASAIKDMMAKMNNRLESGLSPRRWVIKLKSVFTGRSEAELLLADMNALRLQELYLIRRGSGDLIEHWEAVGAGEVAGDPVDMPAADKGGVQLRSNRDAVVSAFLTAINDFAREAFSASDGGLQALDVQSHRIYMRSSPGYLLAAKCSGVPTPQTERLLDQEFAATIEAHRSLLSTKLNGQQPAELRTMLPELAQRMQTGLDSSAEMGAPTKPNLAKWFLILIAAALLGWLLWDKWMVWQTERTRTAVEAVLAGSIMGSYVSGIEVERGGYSVRLRGLAPSEPDKVAVLGALQKILGTTRIEDRIEILPDRGDGGLQTFKRDVLESSASAALSATQRALQRARSRVQQIAAELDRLAREGVDAQSRPALEASSRRVTAAASELEDLAQRAMKATVTDDLASLQSRLDSVLSLLRQSGSGVAEMRGDRAGPVLIRPQPGTERHASVREEAELIANSADALWVEVAATERHLLRQAIAQLNNRPLPVAPAPVGLTPQQQLEDWVRRHAIFFSADTTLRDPGESARLLDALAGLLNQTKGQVRVVGYTDDLGSALRNGGISSDRAVKVKQELIDRGVPAQRLMAVGRPNGPNLSQSTGLNSPNRRVEFEIGFAREAGGG
jgi:outer membrane protein OmpA-like peptidoglycan-associated protein